LLLLTVQSEPMVSDRYLRRLAVTNFAWGMVTLFFSQW
jgi:hypothetical protein